MKKMSILESLRKPVSAILPIPNKRYYFISKWHGYIGNLRFKRIPWSTKGYYETDNENTANFVRKISNKYQGKIYEFRRRDFERYFDELEWQDLRLIAKRENMPKWNKAKRDEIVEYLLRFKPE